MEQPTGIAPHTAKLRRLAALSVIGVTALAFAAPALAANDLPLKVPSAADDVNESAPTPVDEGVIVVSDAPAPAPAEPVNTLAPTEELSSDVQAPVAQTDAPSTGESPANKASSPLPAERSQPSHAAPEEQRAAISPSAPTRAAVRTSAAKTEVRLRTPARVAGQYQTPWAQYQLVSNASGRIRGAASPLRKPHAPQATEARLPHATIGSSNALRTDDWSCPETQDESSYFPSEYAGWKSSRNGSWIPSCTFVSDPGQALPTTSGSDPGEVPSPSESGEPGASGRQYQPGDAQYQPTAPAPTPNDQEPSDSTDAATASEPCDVGDTGEGAVLPGADAPTTSAEGESSGSALEPVAVPAPIGTTEQSQTGTEAQPATVQPNPVSTGARPPEVLSPRGRSGKRSVRAGSASAGANDSVAVGAATSLESPIRSHARSGRTRLQVPADRSHPPARVTPETGAAAGLFVSALASRVTAPASTKEVSSGNGLSLVLFALGLYAVAVVGLLLAAPIARRDGMLVTRIGSRLRSRGLSPPRIVVAGKRAGRFGNGPSGIRYRE